MTKLKKIKKFGKFIRKENYVIPDYQRAYSWGEKQLLPFVKDILEHFDDNDNPNDDTRYYLGHYILEKNKEKNVFEIVDGQQRISTVYLFLLVCDNLTNEDYTKEINFSPVSYDTGGLNAIKEILNQNIDVDDKLDLLLNNSNTASLKKMIEAIIFFKKAFLGSEKSKIEKILDVKDIHKYIQIINDAYCSVAVFNDKSVASQIFELHNTRGVKLTETEKVKALLMKNVYINSESTAIAEENIKEIQGYFADIFKLEELANEVSLRGEMPLDTILMYHLRAVEDGNKTEKFGSPQWFEGDRGSFEYIKEALTKKNNSEEIVIYAKNIAKEFAKSMEIITLDIPKADEKDNNHLIGDVLLLDKSKSLVFLLRAFRNENPIDYNLIKRWENFVLCYDIIYWKGFFYNTNYSNRGYFDSIYRSLKPKYGFDDCSKLLFEYYNGDKPFGVNWIHLGKNVENLFNKHKNKWLSHTYGWARTGYFLYKYEIQNSSRENILKIRKDIFKDDKVSIDHIVARGLSWKNLGFENYDTLPDGNEQKIQANKIWNEIVSVINGIGNLSLSTTSYNSSDSNSLPFQHIDTYEKCGFIKTVNQVKTWENPEQFVYKINERSEDIIKFISESIINRNDIWD